MKYKAHPYLQVQTTIHTAGDHLAITTVVFWKPLPGWLL